MERARVLVTGATGFIGSHVARWIATHTDYQIVGLERYSTSGTPHRLIDAPDWHQIKHRVELICHDLRSPINEYTAKRIGNVKFIAHLAASSHVDRSIADPVSFVLDNVLGTTNLLQFARTQPQLKKCLYFSTDEVFGDAPGATVYKEWDRYHSKNPYAAAKAGGEEMALAFANTYGLPVTVSHTMNVFGEYQHSEKFIPNTIKKILNSQTVTIHASPDKMVSGSRFYIHASDVARTALFLLQRGKVSDKYNIVGEREVTNLEVAESIAKILNKPLHYEMVDFHSSRPGHDLRYGLCGEKLRAMNFKHQHSWDQAIRDTVTWYVEHPEWL